SRDTDGNGRLAISVGPRGELRGDRLERSLRLSNGRVLPIDDLLATSADGRWVVVRRANAVELFDTSEGALLALDDGVDARRTEHGYSETARSCTCASAVASTSSSSARSRRGRSASCTRLANPSCA